MKAALPFVAAVLEHASANATGVQVTVDTVRRQVRICLSSPLRPDGATNISDELYVDLASIEKLVDDNCERATTVDDLAARNLAILKRRHEARRLLGRSYA